MTLCGHSGSGHLSELTIQTGQSANGMYTVPISRTDSLNSSKWHILRVVRVFKGALSRNFRKA